MIDFHVCSVCALPGLRSISVNTSAVWLLTCHLPHHSSESRTSCTVVLVTCYSFDSPSRQKRPHRNCEKTTEQLGSSHRYGGAQRAHYRGKPPKTAKCTNTHENNLRTATVHVLIHNEQTTTAHRNRKREIRTRNKKKKENERQGNDHHDLNEK